MSPEFEAAFAQPVAILLSIAMGGALVTILLRSALVPETRFTGWVRGVTGRNGRYGFALMLLVWTVAMAILSNLGLTANEIGGPALVMLFAGFFLFMGFIWSVIGE
ncbi:MAG: hypothetical protein H0V12_07620 [Chloroflexi bacterium]|nr:hypothetical protein [Chloroflexota bacterium]